MNCFASLRRRRAGDCLGSVDVKTFSKISWCPVVGAGFRVANAAHSAREAQHITAGRTTAFTEPTYLDSWQSPPLKAPQPGLANTAPRGGAPRENTQRPPAQHFAIALGGRAPPGEKEAQVLGGRDPPGEKEA